MWWIGHSLRIFTLITPQQNGAMERKNITNSRNGTNHVEQQKVIGLYLSEEDVNTASYILNIVVLRLETKYTPMVCGRIKIPL